MQYYENQKANTKTVDELNELIEQCGLTDQFLVSLKGILNKNNFDVMKLVENIAEYNLLKIQIEKLIGEKQNFETINEQLGHAEQRKRENIKIYIQNIVNSNVMEYWRQGVTIKRIIQKLSKAFGQSKRAFKTFDKLRRDPANFNTILDIIPVWMMELDDASRIIPLQAGMFDYVILDEASQCNIAYTLPSMFRAKKALFVGDSEQMRDSTVMFKSNKAFEDLAKRYHVDEDLRIKSSGSAVQSVLEIAALRGLTKIPLRYHYRSPDELIGFSNENFYKPKGLQLIALNNNYFTYENTNRIMLIHKVESDWSQEISDKINVAEALSILDFFKELKNDSQYNDKSIGILTFFNAQATYLRELFEKEGFNEDEDNYKISIIEGIQGDEKDIVIYSFVIRSVDQKNKYVPLTGEGGDIRGDVNKGRVNVAFSRARLQVHCFVSMEVHETPDDIWIKKYLEYVQKNGEVDFYNINLNPFDSYFEEEFYALVKNYFKKTYIVQNQVRSCGFKIDFVISNTKTNKRLAIECDGPTHFKDEVDEEYGIYVESDEERQAVLESAGWNFYRIKYSDWINDSFNRNKIIEDITSALN